MIYYKNNDKGLGIYSATFISAGQIIEKCPIIVITEDFPEKHTLTHYEFKWHDKFGAIVLGYGSLYNHSFYPNATYIRDFENNLMLFVSLKDIMANEEILINYMGSPFINQDTINHLWFTPNKETEDCEKI